MYLEGVGEFTIISYNIFLHDVVSFVGVGGDGAAVRHRLGSLRK